MKRSNKIFLAILIVAVAGVIVYAALPRPVPIEVAPVVRGHMKVTVDEEGKTRVRDRYTISAPLSGHLLRPRLDPGDRVEAGKTRLFSMEPSVPDFLDVRREMELEARVRGARAMRDRAVSTLEKARVDHEYALSALERLRKVHGHRAVSRQELEDAEARERMAFRELEGAQMGVRVARFELEQARASLHFVEAHSLDRDPSRRFEVFSPVSGSVLRVFRESEAVVGAGESLLEVGDLSELEVEVEVLSADAVRIRPGAKVILERWGGDESLEGRVIRIDPSGFTKVSALGVEEQRVLVIVEFTEPHEKWRFLGDSFRVDARIVVSEAEDVLKIPAGALFRHEGDWSVFVVEGGKAALRSVTIGLRNDLEAQVLEGLRENDEVITYPGDRVEHNVSVTAR